MKILDIAGLSVAFGERRVVSDVSLSVEAGQVMGLVGQSGSGKSLTALAILDLLPEGARRGGSIRLADETISGLDDAAMCRIRGGTIGMIFQEPAAALNPIMPIGHQVAETIRIHERISRAEAANRAGDMLRRVGLPAEIVPHDRFPHQLSGGQCQRVAIAATLVMRPQLLIADEPTTALDVTTQAEILTLLRALAAETGMSLVFISHDLRLLAGFADEIAVMHQGRIVEQGVARDIIAAPRDGYTRALVAASFPDAVSTVSRPKPASSQLLLEARGLTRIYSHRSGPSLTAVDRVDLTIAAGERVALVGQSGCGKSTLLRLLLGLERPQSGTVMIDGTPLNAARPGSRAYRRILRQMQAVFQDPVSSLDPRWTAERIVTEPLALLERPPDATDRRRLVAAMLEQVGLSTADLDRYPHQFSGGQRQRLAIARALIIEPKLLALDEATSALDEALKVEILELIRHLSVERGLACFMITHDLSSVRRIADRVLVMHAARIIEAGTTEEVLTAPREIYTKRLLAASLLLPRSA